MNADTPRPATGREAALSDLLLRIWTLARECGSDTFQDAVLAECRKRIPFDGALWGYASVAGTVLRVHSVHLVDVPREALREYERVKSLDLVAHRAILSPGRSIGFEDGRGASRADPRWTAFNRRWGLHSLSTVMRVQPHARLAMFSSFYRNRTRAPFTARERRLHEAVVPHLQGAFESELLRGIERASRERVPGAFGAVADRVGHLHLAEAGFERLLHAEWPSWVGPAIPEEARRVLDGGAEFVGREVVLDGGGELGELLALWVRPRAPADRLPPRQLEVAAAWADGRSAKEIAARLGISPNTVRNRIQEVYAKLEVGDRVALQRALRRVAEPGPARPESLTRPVAE